MKTLTFAGRPWALLMLVAGLLGCTDEQPLQPEFPVPGLAVNSGTLSGFGSAQLDGVITPGEWDGAGTLGPFQTSLPGGALANVTLRVMNDAEWLYVAVEYDVILPGPGNEIRLLFEAQGVTDIFRFSGDQVEDRFLSLGFSTLDTRGGGRSDVLGARGSSSGRTAYEMARKLVTVDAGSFDVAFLPGEPVRFTLELIPTGGTVATSRSGWVTATQPNDPRLPDALITVSGPYCQVSVTARRTASDQDQPGYDADFFRLVRAVPSNGVCLATFIDLPLGSSWVFSAHNTLIAAGDQFAVWPNSYATPVALDVPLPNQQGAVFVESPLPGSSRPLTTDHYYEALAAAQPFQAYELRSMSLYLTPGRSVACTAGTGNPALIHAMTPLDFTRVPARPARTLPPALGLFVSRAITTSCTLQGMPNEHVVVEATDANGAVYRGLVGPTDTEVTLDQDPPIFRASYIVDDWQDASPLDLGLVVFGVGRNFSGGPTNELLIKADVRGLDAGGLARYEFELSLGGVGLTISNQLLRVTVECNDDGTGRCRIISIDPGVQSAVVLSPMLMPITDSRVSPTTGNGFVLLRIDVTRVNIVDLRLRSRNSGNQDDFAPNDHPAPSLKYARWVRSAEEGNSFAVSF
jgi:hypothetical protein